MSYSYCRLMLRVHTHKHTNNSNVVFIQCVWNIKRAMAKSRLWLRSRDAHVHWFVSVAGTGDVVMTCLLAWGLCMIEKCLYSLWDCYLHMTSWFPFFIRNPLMYQVKTTRDRQHFFMPTQSWDVKNMQGLMPLNLAMNYPSYSKVSLAS